MKTNAMQCKGKAMQIMQTSPKECIANQRKGNHESKGAQRETRQLDNRKEDINFCYAMLIDGPIRLSKLASLLFQGQSTKGPKAPTYTHCVNKHNERIARRTCTLRIFITKHMMILYGDT